MAVLTGGVQAEDSDALTAPLPRHRSTWSPLPKLGGRDHNTACADPRAAVRNSIRQALDVQLAILAVAIEFGSLLTPHALAICTSVVIEIEVVLFWRQPSFVRCSVAWFAGIRAVETTGGLHPQIWNSKGD